jgi:hypothetical protein
MATTEKDFRVKKGLIVGQDATIGGILTVGTINATTVVGVALEKQYTQIGALTVGDVGVRWYPATNITINSAIARIVTAPSGSSITLSIKVNGTGVQTLTINSGATDSSLVTTPINVNYGQYVTIEVIQVGSSIAGSDLNVTLKYIRV